MWYINIFDFPSGLKKVMMLSLWQHCMKTSILQTEANENYWSIIEEFLLLSEICKWKIGGFKYLCLHKSSFERGYHCGNTVRNLDPSNRGVRFTQVLSRRYLYVEFIVDFSYALRPFSANDRFYLFFICNHCLYSDNSFKTLILNNTK